MTFHPSFQARSEQPFNLSPQMLRRAWQAAEDRPRGMTRYTAFADELEFLAGQRNITDKGIQAYTLGRRYAVLKALADKLADGSERLATAAQDAGAQGLEVLFNLIDDYKHEFPDQ